MIKNIEDVTCAFLHDLDLVCFSHLRWAFVYQRPQHLLSRFAKHTRVIFVEEPMWHDGPDVMRITQDTKNVFVAVPHLQNGNDGCPIMRQQKLVNSLFPQLHVKKYFAWYYTPMALPFTEHLSPEFIVYDCMDELSAFKFAPPELTKREKQLLDMADVVFTGGHCIYEHKKNQHPNIHPFPSSIDKVHFGTARTITEDPADQANIPHPRFGFIGVIDERMDIDLVGKVAAARPDWHFVMIGPVVKIDPATLPKYDNVHYLGGKDYKELPSYIAGWDIAMIPFAMNESTKFISPTKTPEYLAAGKPVISTPIRDVVRPYGDNKLVHIASTPEEFIACAEKELKKKGRKTWTTKVDNFLAGNSWDRTWSQMVRQIENIVTRQAAGEKDSDIKESAIVG
ncbi:Glycosyltransferase involved in cell wall bisynthesis [Cnuella takakiae]|uniref:Glycosyltransferase involved in cell wall bisynthesis n=1 Tax=Cnuella takakiae TaxID=1302690 RepID=A0A1M4VNB5_9BACT|nr:glycosyltransferase family 1 protein [Cnuella takakiae]OLY92548.1 glycosyl transferase [Cnuella takakiae]SHE70343.1 Glycosyltransferase involved in cell wall bisynthesis [Cnuella takakiae]